MSVFEFQDYRKYLRAFLESLPRKGYGGVNRVAGHLGVNSSLVSQILGGHKDFSLEQAQELCSFIGLSGVEADYFLLLVQKERAGTKKLKSYFDEKIEEARRRSLKVSQRMPQDRKLTDQERAVFYSSWLYSATRLFSSLGQGASVDDVAARFDISRARAAEILEFLRDKGLCVVEKDKFRMGPQRTHLETGSPFLARHHANWRMKAVQRAEDVAEEEVMFTGPLSISKRDFAAVKEQILSLLKSASDRVTASDPEEIACLNVDLFWIRK